MDSNPDKAILSGDPAAPLDDATSIDVTAETRMYVDGDSVDDGRTGRAVLHPGEKIGKYEVRARLGAGGMGAVYLAFDPMIEREVAIKVLSQDVGTSGAALQRFLQEARAIGRLNHPHIVSIYDIDQWQGRYYLVMELLAGGSLSQSTEDRGPLPWPEACELAAQAASGLAAAHAAGLIHRDIKPENLMLTRDRLLKVVDFGLSKLVDAESSTRTTVTQAGQILGTPQYMSPEQFQAAAVDFRTDIYSLGGTLFRLLTARFPYYECASVVQVMTAHLTKPPPPATALNAEIPPECDRIIARAMAKLPADRYQTAGELADDLRRVIHRRSAPPAASAAAAPARRPLKSAVIVEPSRMLGGMLKSVVARGGAGRIDVVQTRQAALLVTHDHSPDLLLTAMQLNDGRGVDLLAELDRQLLLKQTCVVLCSSDSTLADLAVARSAPCRILAPKQSRHEDVLRMVHALSPCAVSGNPLAEPLDPDRVRLAVISTSGQISPTLDRLIQQLSLTHVLTSWIGDPLDLPADDIPTTLLVEAGAATAERELHAQLETLGAGSGALLAALVRDGDRLLLRAGRLSCITAELNAVLDAQRLTDLLQACRP